jgi:phycocyanin-associated, rod
MLGQAAFSRGSSVSSNNRIFVYEVSGLQPSMLNVPAEHQIRTSANTFVQVPYNRMNEKMQQILRMGGKIVSIRALGDNTPAAPKKGKSKKDE